MDFIKMHGIGNDYVYLDAVQKPELADRADLSELARAMSDRHRGIGSDGLILVCLPTEAGAKAGAQVRMRMFNADGSESEMCGNGVRCVAKIAHDELGFRRQPLMVETGRGVLAITCHTDATGLVAEATVDMGVPVLEPAEVPVEMSRLGPGGRIVEAAAWLVPGAESWGAMTPVSMGNPHAVWFVDEPVLDAGFSAALAARMASLERHSAFPRRANIHLARVVTPSRVEMLTWERGAGFTQACGTGACAVVVAGVLRGVLSGDAAVTAVLPGGELRIAWRGLASGQGVAMTGPAEEVCRGVWAERPVVPAKVPMLTTARLVLRAAEQGDAEAVQRVVSSAQVARGTLSLKHPAPPWLGTWQVARAAAGVRTGKRVNWLITERETGRVLGDVGIWINTEHEAAGMGYMLHPDHWGHGYATEAVGAVVDYCMEELKLNSVWAGHFAWNEASGRVMQKVGMVRGREQAWKKGERFEDDVLYTITRERWARHRAERGGRG